MKNDKTKSFWVWLTAIAMLMTALMPALSHSARALSGTESLSPICTSSGLKWFDPVSGEIREQTLQSDTQTTNEHCTWCCVHPPVLIAQPTFIPPIFLKLAETLVPTFPAISGAFVWPPSHPRAPPVFA